MKLIGENSKEKAMLAERVTVRELSEFLGVSERTIQRLVKDGILPTPKTKGQYALFECVQGFIRNEEMNALFGSLNKPMKRRY